MSQRNVNVFHLTTGEVENVYGKFTQDNTHKSLSKSVRFCGRYDRKLFGVFLIHSVYGTGKNGKTKYNSSGISSSAINAELQLKRT